MPITNCISKEIGVLCCLSVHVMRTFTTNRMGKHISFASLIDYSREINTHGSLMRKSLVLQDPR